MNMRIAIIVAAALAIVAGANQCQWIPLEPSTSSDSIEIIDDPEGASKIDPAAWNYTADTGGASANNYVILGAGLQKQHVGILQGQDIFNAVFKCLQELCPPVPNGSFMCNNIRKSCIINGIWWEGGTDLSCASSDGYLTVKAYGSHLDPSKDYIRSLMLRMLAGMYQVQTETYENQYLTQIDPRVDYINGGFNVMINVPEFVSIRFNDWIIEVSLQFNGPTRTGWLNCRQSEEGILRYMDDNIRRPFANAVGIAAQNLASEVRCEKPQFFN